MKKILTKVLSCLLFSSGAAVVANPDITPSLNAMWARGVFNRSLLAVLLISAVGSTTVVADWQDIVKGEVKDWVEELTRYAGNVKSFAGKVGSTVNPMNWYNNKELVKAAQEDREALNRIHEDNLLKQRCEKIQEDLAQARFEHRGGWELVENTPRLMEQSAQERSRIAGIAEELNMPKTYAQRAKAILSSAWNKVPAASSVMNNIRLMSTEKKVALGTALVAVPLAGYAAYKYFTKPAAERDDEPAQETTTPSSLWFTRIL